MSTLYFSVVFCNIVLSTWSQLEWKALTFTLEPVIFLIMVIANLLALLPRSMKCFPGMSQIFLSAYVNNVTVRTISNQYFKFLIEGTGFSILPSKAVVPAVVRSFRREVLTLMARNKRSIIL